MNKLSVFLWLVFSAVLAILGNVLAAGVQEKYDLINNEARWAITVLLFVACFIVLLYLELRRSNSRNRINSVATGIGSQIGRIKMRYLGSGDLDTATVNDVSLGPLSSAKSIDMSYETDNESKHDDSRTR